MDKIKLWSIVASVGLIVAVIGFWTAVSGAGLDEQVQVDEDWEDVDNLHVYYLEMSCKGGEPVDLEYTLSAGTMEVRILTDDGFDELMEDGSASSSEIMLSRTSQSSGTILWTPSQDAKYMLAFYDFSQTGTTVHVEGTFSGASESMFFVGIGVAVIGIVIVIVAAVQRRKLVKVRDATKPQDVVMYPQDTRPKEPPTS